MQCKKCNQTFNDDSKFCPYCAVPVTNYNEINNSKTKKRILSAILSFLIFAVPIGISRGLREYNREQQKQESRIPRIDIDAVNDILDPNTEEEQNIAGTHTEGAYENNFFGIGCKLQGWTFLSEDELSELLEQSTTSVPDEEGRFFAFKAENSDGTANVNMLIESTLGENPDEKYVLESIADQTRNGEGIKYCECVEGKIAEESKYILKTISTNDNIDIYTYQFLYFRETNYAVITIVALTDDEAERICQQFYKTEIK